MPHIVSKNRLLSCVAAVLLCLLPAAASAATFTVFGPEVFVRGNGKPVPVARSFAANPAATYTLHVDNGVPERVSSAVVKLNGDVVLKESDFNQNVGVLDRSVTLQAENTLEVELRSAPGSGFRLTITGVLPDGDPPVLEILSPEPGTFVAAAAPEITAVYFDAESGVDPASVRVLIDGVDRTLEAQVDESALSLTPAAPLAEGPHRVEVAVRDRAAQETRAAVSFTVDTVAPALAIPQPSQEVILDDTAPAIRVDWSDDTSGVDPETLLITLDDADLRPSCSFAGSVATCATSALFPGAHTVTAQVFDRAANLASAARSFTILVDEEPPSLIIVSPGSPLITGDDTPEIRVEYSDAGRGVDPSSLRLEIDGIGVTGGCQPGPSSAVCEPPALVRGAHSIIARISDQKGNVASDRFDFTLSLPVDVAFTEPEPEFLTGVASARVAGVVSPGARSVRVNGVEAELGAGTFLIESLGLHDGVNDLIAVAEDGAGNVGTATVRVVADTTPPGVSVTFPVEGSLVSAPVVNVAGLVNDLTTGTVSDTQVNVTVNGVAAQVENRSFVASGVPLQPGFNVLRAVATDRAGNQAAAEIRVTLAAGGGPSLRVVSGDGQSSPVSAPLPEPLVAGVFDAAGLPVRDAQVVFRVAQGNGVLDGGARAVLVRTDEQGRAMVHWTLGSRAGVGVNRVRATAVGIAGEASFLATALTAQPAAIDVASGNDQRGAVGEELSRPLFAIVTDEGHNPVPGIPVTFRIIRGGGGFAEAGSADSVIAETDASGRASARLVLGPETGLDNNRVEAVFDGLANLPAAFKASGFAVGDPAETRISGVVLDNQGLPVPGVTMRLRDSALTAVTDAQGQFRLAGVPVGQVFLIADATTVTRPGHWASLEYEMFTLAGVDNSLLRPIYILPLDLPNGVYVDETRGGTVTLPEIPGFALEIAPGSVTFPGGSKSGVVSVTAVHADRIPMPPGAGMQPRLIVTVQPAGALFDPPAEFTLPNVDGLAPGTVTELFSFDHDIGDFVAIGTGTVSEDGLVVRSDPGFGILEAGWHCGAPPGGSGASATLGVRIANEEPVVLLESDASVPAPALRAAAAGPSADAVLRAEGSPQLDAVYSWEISKLDVASLSLSGAGLCAGATACETGATAGVSGDALATVTMTCLTTGATATDTKKVVTTKVRLKEVAYSADGYRPIREDWFKQGCGSPSCVYDAPHWQDNSTPPNKNADDPKDRKFPVRFKIGSKVKVTATFETDPPVPNTKFKVFGANTSSTYNFGVPEQEAVVRQDGKLIISAVLKGPLPTTVDVLNLQIPWYVSLDGDTYEYAGSSENRVYVTLADPTNSNPLYETVLDISCRNAKGATNPADAVKMIWEKDFAQASKVEVVTGTEKVPGVKRKAKDGYNRVDGATMTFWVDFRDPRIDYIQQICQEYKAMINPERATSDFNGIGTCAAWADLFRETLLAQGIEPAKVEIIDINPIAEYNPAGLRAELMVNKWGFTEPGSANCYGFRYLINDSTREFRDLAGKPAQGTANPHAHFKNHYVIKYSSQFYDPSYGTGPYPSQDAWENDSIAGFYIIGCTQGKDDLGARKNNSNKREVVFTPVRR